MLLTNSTQNYLNEQDGLEQYLESIDKYKVLKPSEEIDLIKKAQAGDTAAKEKLILHNQKLILHFINKIEHLTTNCMNKLDLISEGNIGLIKAIEKYDTTSNGKFSTYAYFWIRQSIYRAFSTKRNLVRIPEKLRRDWSKIFYFKEDYFIKNNTYPTDDEIIKTLKINKDYLDKYNTSQYQIGTIVSLDMPIKNDAEEESFLGDFIKDNNSNIETDVLNAITDEDFLKTLNEILENGIKNKIINPRHVEIFKYRYGLIDGDFHTLEMTGQKYNITRERARQIESKVLKYLRFPANKIKLRYFRKEI